MKNLKQILSRWSVDRQVLSSPPIKDRKLFVQIKHMLTRSWIHAEYAESQGIIRISLSPEESLGKSNIQKLEKLNITF